MAHDTHEATAWRLGADDMGLGRFNFAVLEGAEAEQNIIVECGRDRAKAEMIIRDHNERLDSQQVVKALTEAAQGALTTFRYLRDNHLQLWTDAATPEVCNAWDKLRAALKLVEGKEAK